MILKIHEARSRLAKLGCFKDVGVFIDTYEGPDARDDGIEVSFLKRFFAQFLLNNQTYYAVVVILFQVISTAYNSRVC